MPKTKFDITTRVKLCELHKNIFNDSVRIKTLDEYGIRPGQLCSLWLIAEACLDCSWETTFGEE